MANSSNLVIYGASGGGQKVQQCFQSFGIMIDYFIDSNEELWGNIVNGIPVCPPEELLNKNYRIVIASDVGYTSIRKILQEKGMLEKCVLREEVILSKAEELLCEFLPHGSKLEVGSGIIEQKALADQSVFLELLEGYQLGGIENWSYMVAKGLANKKVPVEILAKEVEDTPEGWNGLLNDEFDGEYSSYKECIKQLVRYISKNIPCKIILNKQQQLFYAGYILKQIYPDKVKIYSVIHNDLESIYERNSFLEKHIDGFLCVSQKIKNELQDNYGISNIKLYYKESPVLFEHRENINKGYVKKYTTNSSLPIQISYGARLEKVQKRADLLIPLIEELELRKVNYMLHIAGDGSYYSIIRDYLLQNNYEYKVKLYGRLEHWEMEEFWNKSDIFINLSEMEGVGISMLEAMKCGNIPIEFEVAGCDEFIVDGSNGYIIPYCNYNMMVDRIQYLSDNRELLAVMGKRSRTIIHEKCDYDAYIEYIQEVLF